MGLISKYKTPIVLVISMIGIALFCDILCIFEKPPTSLHIWRQADCLSLTKNYSESLNFFEPSIHNFISENETSGKTVGEFPIIYYFVGLVWSIFGESIYFYRLFGLLVYCIGILYLFKTCQQITKDKYWSFFISILFYSSPVLFYYSFNFLTNVFAFSFALIGWYHFVKYLQNEHRKSLWYFSIFVLLAGLLKVTALVSIFALAAGLVIDSIARKKLPRTYAQTFLSILLICIVVVVWFAWADAYNSAYGGKYTFNSIWPIWELSEAEIIKAVIFGKEFIYRQMLSPVTWSLIWTVFLLICFNLKKHWGLISGLIILFFGCLLYSILWFSAFDAHDYYTINLMVLPLATVVVGFYYAGYHYPSFLKSKTLKIGGALLLLFNCIYLSNNIHVRYIDRLWNDDVTYHALLNPTEKQTLIETSWSSNHYDSLYQMRDFNRSIGIQPEDLIIFIPDGTFNASLYLLNQKGWTGFSGNYTTTAEGIQAKIEKNAKYLILGDLRLKDEAFLQSFLHNSIGEYKGREVFKLQ